MDLKGLRINRKIKNIVVYITLLHLRIIKDQGQKWRKVRLVGGRIFVVQDYIQGKRLTRAIKYYVGKLFNFTYLKIYYTEDLGMQPVGGCNGRIRRVGTPE